jgi:hypothetical protein
MDPQTAGSTVMAVLTELAMKHSSCARWCNLLNQCFVFGHIVPGDGRNFHPGRPFESAKKFYASHDVPCPRNSIGLELYTDYKQPGGLPA